MLAKSTRRGGGRGVGAVARHADVQRVRAGRHAAESDEAVLRRAMLPQQLDVLLVAPVRVPLDETPSLALYQNWALGLVFLKIWMRCVTLGAFGEAAWRERFERVAEHDVLGVRFGWTLAEVVLPLVGSWE